MDKFQDWVVYGLAICGGIAIFVSGLKGVEFLLSPFTEIKDRLGNHEEMLKNDKKRLDDIEQWQDEMQDQMACIGLAMAELMNHIITGNDTDKLKEQQENLLKTFIK